jgi:ribosomal protein S18 acetylase RimI-like enzyme
MGLDQAYIFTKGVQYLDVKLVDSDEGIDWERMSELYMKAPLGNKSPSDLKTVFSNSRYKCFLFERGTLVGAGRALADGLDCSYICDIALLPEYQGKGLGTIIIKHLIEKSKGYKKILLYSAPGSEGFYTKLGFKKMRTALAIFENQERATEVGLVSKL